MKKILLASIAMTALGLTSCDPGSGETTQEQTISAYSMFIPVSGGDPDIAKSTYKIKFKFNDNTASLIGNFELDGLQINGDGAKLNLAQFSVGSESNTDMPYYAVYETIFDGMQSTSSNPISDFKGMI